MNRCRLTQGRFIFQVRHTTYAFESLKKKLLCYGKCTNTQQRVRNLRLVIFAYVRVECVCDNKGGASSIALSNSMLERKDEYLEKDEYSEKEGEQTLPTIFVYSI